MTGLYGTLWPYSSPQPTQPNLVWEQYEETKRDPKSPLGSAAHYVSGSSGVVETTAIPGHSVTADRVRLYSMTRYELTETDYMLDLRAVDGSQHRRGGSLRCLLHLRRDEIALLTDRGAEKDGKIQARILLRKSAPVGFIIVTGRLAKNGGIASRMFRSSRVRFG
jgi:hypothetical protein